MSFATEAWTPAPKSRAITATSRTSTMLRQEDDWTRVKDPKEKKRIQNRVAQRTYRHRMKARLGELQARLDSHEGRKPSISNATATSPDQSACNAGLNTTSPVNTTESASHRGSISVPMSQPYNGNPTPPSHGPGEESPSPVAMEAKPQMNQMPLMQPNLYDQPVVDADAAMFHNQSHFLNSPPHSRSSPQAHGLLSPPGQPGSDGSGNVPQDFMMECLQFQTQLLTRLHTIEPENPYPGLAGQGDATVPNNMTQADQPNCVPTAFAPSTADLAFEATAPVDVWKTEPLDPGPIHQSLRQDTSPADMNFRPLPAHVRPAMNPGPDMNSRPNMPSQQRSLEERFEPIMQQVEAAGFDSFDALVTAYYSDSFNDVSPLANEQRLSRNRRLPKVVSDVFQAANSWSSWESTGFQEEILKSTEQMLLAEGSMARNSLMSKIAPLVDSQEAMGSPQTAEALHSMKRAIQTEVPNAWALCMSLAADQRSSWQHDRSNTALATVLLLNYSGRIPNDQLLRLIGTCL